MKNFKKLLREHRRAFTLAEVVIVMAILSIMMVAFAPVMTKKANTSTDSFRTFQRTTGNHGVYYGTRTDSKPVVIGDNELRYGANYQPKLVIAATTVGDGASTRLTPHISFLTENINNDVKFATGQLIVSGGYVSANDVGSAPDIPTSVAMNNDPNFLHHLMPIAFATAQNKVTATPATVNPTLPGGGGGTGNYWSSDVLLTRGVSVILGGNPDANYAFDVGGDRMTVVGGFACSGATNGVDGLTCFGSETGRDAELAANTVFVGREAGRSATSLNGGIYIGNQAGMSSTVPSTGTPESSVFIGRQSGARAANTDGSVFIGDSAGAHAAATTSVNAGGAVFIGRQAGNEAQYPTDGVFIGRQAGLSVDTAERGIYIGAEAGSASGGSEQDYGGIFIGYQAGTKLARTDHAIFIGDNAGPDLPGEKAIGSIFIGHLTAHGMEAESSSQNLNNMVIIGNQAAWENENTNSGAVVIGSYAAAEINANDGIKVQDAVVIGNGAGRHQNYSGNATDSVMIGHSAVANAQHAIAIGHDAKALQEGAIVIGYNAGAGMTQGAYKIYLGTPDHEYTKDDLWLGGSQLNRWICWALGGTWLLNPNNYCQFPSSHIAMDDNIQLALLTGNESAIPSDERLKNVGKPFKDGLELIEKIMPVNFTYKRDENKIQHVGVIAQDLMKIIPNAVNSNKDGFLYIRTEDMFYAAINAIKELHQMFLDHDKRIKQLEARNAVLEQQNKELMELYTELAKRVERLDNKKTKDVKFTPMPVFEEETEEEVKTEK